MTQRHGIAARLPALDGLRGIAILLVLFFHYEIRDLPPLSLLLPARAIVHMGWLGVDLFFVLSGFLITGILLDTREEPRYFRNFYARRTLRILPLYYGFLAFGFFALPHLPALGAWQTPPASSQVWFWLHLSNLLIAARGWGASPPLVPHFWSLAVEEQFYLLWPTIVFLVSRRALFRICVGCVALALCVRIGLRFTSWPWYACLTFTPARLDALALGALVAQLVRAPDGVSRVARHAGRVALISGVLCAALFGWRRFANGEDALIGTFGMTLFDVFAASAVAFGASADGRGLVQRVLRATPLTIAGRYSYGMYVIHVLVLKVIDGRGFGIAALTRRFGSVAAAHALNLGLNLAGTVGLAALSFHLFERRFLALKDRFFA